MSFVTAKQLRGAYEVAAKASAHFHHTGETAHPDTNTTSFPAPNHRRGPHIFSGRCRKFTRFSGQQCHGPVPYVEKKLEQRPALNAAVVEFVPASVLGAAAANTAAAAIIGATAVTSITRTSVEEKFKKRENLWEDSTPLEAANHSTAFFAPIGTGRPGLWAHLPSFASAQNIGNIANVADTVGHAVTNLPTRSHSNSTTTDSATSTSTAITSVLDELSADQGTESATEPLETWRQLAKSEIEMQAFAYGLDLEILGMQGRKLIGWVACTEEGL